MKSKTEKTLPKMLRGSVHRQFKKCGKPNCKCASGKLHGAYYYHFARVNGKLKKRYLKADEVEQIQIACIKRRRDEKQRRARLQTDWEQLREIRTEMSEFRNHFSS
jgi:hypothetical protein